MYPVNLLSPSVETDAPIVALIPFETGFISETPALLSVNKEKFNINWNDVVKSNQEPYDINNDNIPDIISWEQINTETTDPPIFYIKDYNGNDIWSFNIKEH